MNDMMKPRNKVGRHWVQVWLRERELAPLVALLLIASGIVLFGILASLIMEGDMRTFDQALLLAMRNPANPGEPLGPPELEEVARDVTALGGVVVLSLVTLTVVGYLMLQRRYRVMAFVIISVGGGALLSMLMKQAFARPRPDLVAQWSYVDTASFPSGHSMLSAITYLTLAGLLAQMQQHRRVKVYLISLATLLTILIGISRVYLGLHWPTDVFAGWAAGAAWALLCWLAVRRLHLCGHTTALSDGM